MNKPVSNCETVEIKITSTSLSKFVFPDNAQIKGRKVVAIEAYLLADVTKTPNGLALQAAAVQKTAYLTLSIKGSEKVKNIPVNALVRSLNNGQRFEIEPSIIDLQKSNINYPDTTILVANEAVLLNFFFENEGK